MLIRQEGQQEEISFHKNLWDPEEPTTIILYIRNRVETEQESSSAESEDDLEMEMKSSHVWKYVHHSGVYLTCIFMSRSWKYLR